MELEINENVIRRSLGPSVPVLEVTQFLNSFIDKLSPSGSGSSVTQSSAEMRKYIELSLNMLKDRSSQYEDLILTLRLRLSSIYDQDKMWLRAILCLVPSAFVLDSSAALRSLSTEKKVSVYLRLVRLIMQYLDHRHQDTVHEGDDKEGSQVEVDIAMAEMYLQRASSLIQNLQGQGSINDNDLVLFKECQSRVLASGGKFAEASQKYHELSLCSSPAIPSSVTSSSSSICSSDEALTMAVVCAVIARGSALKVKMLSVLNADKRIADMCDPVLAELLKRLSSGRMLSEKVTEPFVRLLQSLSSSRLPDAGEMFGKAVVEHNLYAISRVYSSISLSRLAQLLAITDTAKVERLVVNMFAADDEGRLCGGGHIDQSDQFVYFSRCDDGSFSDGGPWNLHAETALKQVASLADQLTR